MKLQHLITFSLLAAAPAMADVAQAGNLVQAGKPADALEAIRGDESPDASFWRGRALIDLGRLQEAAAALHKVPAEHHLFPYAAKALLYCAWKSNSVDFAVIATPLATCQNKEIAALATAALAEFWLRQPRSQDNTALERLRQLTNSQPELVPLLRLLEIENMRLRHEFDKAIDFCRELENDRSMPLIMRHRVRLALSEVYYAKEAENRRKNKENPPAPEPELPIIGTVTEQPAEVYDEGKGEETLLHFISSNPESPLLEEAFRRLHVRKAFEKSEYARTKLREWMVEPLKSRRAAMALLIQQHLLNPEKAFDIPLDVTCANTAAATCPNEPATRLILLEQTRWFLEREQTHEALLYLGMIQGDDVYKRFYETQLHTPDAASTARAYLDCAREAPEELKQVALTNALISALRSGDESTQETILNMQELSEEQYYSLLLTRAGYWLDKEPEKAQADIDILKTQSAPNLNLQADLEMDEAYLQMMRDPRTSHDLLNKSKINDYLTKLSDERQLRFFALQEESLRRIAGTGDELNALKESATLIQQAAGKVHSARVVSVLTMHLASLQSAQGLHVEALHTLSTLIRKYPKGDFTVRALYMAARECEFIATHDSLKRAVQLYETCASRSDELAVKSITRQASVLLRLGHHEDSEHLLTGLLRNKRYTLRNEDKVMAHAILANNKALLGTEEGRNQAIEIVGETMNLPDLSSWWRYRILLHHATLCTRAGKHEQALKDYEEVLSMKPATGENPTKAEWHILYSAGSGAVMQLLYLEKFALAADMADRIATWNIQKADLNKRKEFSSWAQFIRQTNFVSKDDLPF